MTDKKSDDKTGKAIEAMAESELSMDDLEAVTGGMTYQHGVKIIIVGG